MGGASPTDADRAVRAALNHLRTGAVDAAAQALARLDAADLLRPDAQHALGRIASARGDHAEALAHARHAVALAPSRPELHYTVGLHALDAQQPDLALAAFQDALALRPDWTAATLNLGLALQDLGRHREAVAAFDRVLGQAPGHAGAWNNRAVSCLALDDVQAAADAAARAVAFAPDDLRFRINQVEASLASGDQAVAAEQVHALLAMPQVPSNAATLQRLGAAAVGRRAWALVEPLLEPLVALGPAGAAALAALAKLAEDLGEHGHARQYLGLALTRAPGDWALRVRHDLMLDEVYASEPELHAARARHASALDALGDRIARRPPAPDALPAAMRRTSFLLAYQGEDDLRLQRAYGRILAESWRLLAPDLAVRRPVIRGFPGRRLRVGYIGAHFRDCTVGHYFRSWITLLPASQFQRTLLLLGGRRDAYTQELAGHCDAVFDLAPLDLRPAAARVADLDLDVLIYPELGMDPDTYPLAALRLAPLQCAGWGHPVTTGMETVDLFFSSDAAEPPGADAHYTERLIRLPGLGTSYSAPPVPRAADRSEFGLPHDAVAWFYPHSPFKIHPAGDDALFRVLERTPGSVLVLIEGPTRAGTERLLGRLRAAATEHGVAPDRLRCLPALPRARFLELAGACDAMLDPWHWSGGNTSLDALAAGLPIVTLPGAFMRGRQSAAMLHMIGVPELVARDADDFVAIATRLASDPDWRARLRARIDNGRARLFDDPAPVAALAEHLLREATRRATGDGAAA